MNGGADGGHLQRFLLLLVALAYGGLTWVVVFTLGLREPFADQWRQQVPLLEQELPWSVLQLESGHRQALPNLVRLVDLRLGGDGEVLAVTGTVLFALVYVVLLHWCWRHAGPRRLPRWRAAALLGLGLGFLVHARMLLHPNEMVQVGGVLLGLAVALRAVLGGDGNGRLVLAIAAAIAATFCFGSGVAVFGVLLVLLPVLRRPWRQVLIVLLAAAAVGAGYLWLLPGGGTAASGAGGSGPAAGPWITVPRWLGAPFVQAFFGLGQPGFQAGIADAVMRYDPHGGLWVDLARRLATPLGPAATMRLGGAAFGWGGLVLLVGALLAEWRRNGALRRGEAVATGDEGLRRLGLGLALFAVGVGALIGLARAVYFAGLPDQVFAERYVVWSSLFWCGLALRFVAPAPGLPRLATLTVVLVAVLLWPVQRAWLSWGAQNRSAVENAALALRLGLPDPAIVPPPADLGALSWERCVEAVRSRDLCMFGEVPLPALGERLPPPPAVPAAAPVLSGARRLTLADGRVVLHWRAELPAELLQRPEREWPIVDEDGVVRGRLRADEARPWLRRLPAPLAARRGNAYAVPEPDGPLLLVTPAPPFAVLAVLGRS